MHKSQTGEDNAKRTQKNTQIEQAMSETEKHKSHEKIDTFEEENPRYASFLHKSEITQNIAQLNDIDELK